MVFISQFYSEDVYDHEYMVYYCKVYVYTQLTIGNPNTFNSGHVSKVEFDDTFNRRYNRYFHRKIRVNSNCT